MAGETLELLVALGRRSPLAGDALGWTLDMDQIKSIARERAPTRNGVIPTMGGTS